MQPWETVLASLWDFESSTKDLEHIYHIYLFNLIRELSIHNGLEVMISC